MKIVIFGATGRTGSEIVRRALWDGHEVKALVRTPEKCTPRQGLTLFQGDVRDTETVKQLIEGANAVVSALGTDRTTTLTEAMPVIVEEMELHSVARILTIGTAGILQSRTDPSKLRYEAGDSNRKLTFAAKEHHKVFDILRSSSLDWTIVCPTYLPDGEAVGNYRVERDYLPVDGKQISVGDTAEFAYRELIAGEHIGHRIGLSY
ncbi:NAD(P)-dependent oxidoreductase [Sporosarcina aquimarina]|uniref:NAD(P)-dependent oxidoreductase n=1 Tax=Sporosarcina aquimarina TaxID=114975 RepID=UPI001C8D1989|nr:SDR family oxidoreductase [Sporosarcina aquimarina]MBY0222852.1 SDR family oxidoreductase [Sporosarcina aquimarina]